MEIQGKKALILGGAGLVGRAICNQLIEAGVGSLVVCSLFEKETTDYIEELKAKYPEVEYSAEWGDIFVRWSMKDMKRGDILNNPENRALFVSDVIDPLSRDILTESSIYKLLDKHKPDIVIDSINTASVIAYQNIFASSKEALSAVSESGQVDEAVEKLISTQYMPQLIRHVQIFLQSMNETKTKFYLKIGTCGTGGMGLNIPYTHSEDRPSQMLLSKAAVAGAHSLLLFLMARTPGGTIIKELKPAAAIAWKKVGYGPISKKGQKILMEDVSMDNVTQLKGMLSKLPEHEVKYYEANGEPRPLEAPFIDSGENGLFSQGEFEALTDAGQMEFITPEEIAQNAVWEIQGGNTGHDIVAAFDNSIMGPTFRAGYMRQGAISELRRVVKEHKTESVAFELLGPPRLSKLLYEAFLIKECFGTFDEALASSSEDLSKKLEEKISTDDALRSRIISIGIPILMPLGQRLVRGSKIAIPAEIPGKPDVKFEVSEDKVDKWAHDGWVDLRPRNMARWQTRFRTIMATVNDIPAEETGSTYTKGKHYWMDEDGKYTISYSKLASWIFIHEDQGIRMK